jgi:hypothetical protein
LLEILTLGPEFFDLEDEPFGLTIWLNLTTLFYQGNSFLQIRQKRLKISKGVKFLMVLC